MKKFWEKLSVPSKVGVIISMITFALAANYLKGDLFKDVDTTTLTKEIFTPPKPISMIPLTEPFPESARPQEIQSSSVFWGIIETSPEAEVRPITGVASKITFYKRYGKNSIFYSESPYLQPKVNVSGLFYSYVSTAAIIEKDHVVFYCHWKKYLAGGIILTTALSLFAAFIAYWTTKILVWIPYGIFCMRRQHRKNRIATQH